MLYEYLITDPQGLRTWRRFMPAYQAGIYISLGFTVQQIWR